MGKAKIVEETVNRYLAGQTHDFTGHTPVHYGGFDVGIMETIERGPSGNGKPSYLLRISFFSAMHYRTISGSTLIVRNSDGVILFPAPLRISKEVGDTCFAFVHGLDTSRLFLAIKFN